MLWKKETNKRDAMYADIFALNGVQTDLCLFPDHARCEQTDPTLNKNDAKALQKRNEGNEYFNQGNWIQAIELYGESLCYAENGSKHTSLAFANRANCFLKLEQYNECLIDIELAKGAGYPMELMPKLDRRKEECLKAINEGAQSVMFEPNLSSASDECFPFMANVLKIDVDDDGDLAFFAKEDIDVGQIVAIEKMFMGYIYSWHGIKCNICLKMQTNLVPCKKCTVAMFCNDECQGSWLHGYECGLKACHCDLTNNNIMRVVRSVLMIIDRFENADELMKFVERIISSDRNQLPSSLLDVKSKYEAFLKLPIGSKLKYPKDISCILGSFETLLNIPKIGTMFTTEKHRRFLMHLLWHHYQIVDLNSIITSMKIFSDEATSDGNGHEVSTWASSQTGLISRFIKHSCSPNVYGKTSNGNTMIITVRPIKKGDQIFHTVLLRFLTQSKKERIKGLWHERKMNCKCVRCRGFIASTVQRQKILNDPDYQFLVDSYSSDASIQEFAATIDTRLQKCKSLLRKYGHFPWSEEFGSVVEVFIDIILIQKR